MNARTFLLLQGPASPFLKYLADELEKNGASVRKIGLCLGDVFFWWPRRTDFYRGTRENWPLYLKTYIERHGVTDLVMLGDGRPVHAAAADLGIALGIKVHILEHGYLRPDWLTIEPDGMSLHSRFPREPEKIQALAAGQQHAANNRLFGSSFLTYALYDLVYHVPNVLLGWLVHPHYRTHGAVHPVVEYSGWIWKALTRGRRQRRAQLAIDQCLHSGGDRPSRFFLFPLQLPGDYQIRNHSPGGDLFKIVDATIASFARHAPSNTRLLFKVHPIDNGLSRWPQRIATAAAQYNVADRVFLADGGDTSMLIEKSAGVVTVNSTVGLTALILGRPVIALGGAVYDVPGLTWQQSLGAFWRAPTEPDPRLLDKFLRALAATTQVRGGFIGRDAIETGARNVAQRLLDPDDRLPLAFRKPRGNPQFRYERELFLKN
ncbi:capsular biosynthesis protein [Neorhizobium sp. SOG26]|uniref:capsule biosynthesis protein n=1 Tax=Neorhizobium sp. SOG26 TaxID=2060726 RepID=UPI000E587E9E|nr:capsular biosynthesis protein [Neorhizobium sp. SOG26]AXV15147.1 capsular biosynthesis protein [Neorhizobium sp. SOG26]